MTYTIENTSSWGFEKLAPYTKALTAAFRKFVEHFPDDITSETLVSETRQGKRTLWIVTDQKGEFKNFFMTQVRALEATGKRVAALTTWGGRDGLRGIKDICREAEQWADEQGAEIYQVEVREGLVKALEKLGYETHCVVMRKKAKGNG